MQRVRHRRNALTSPERQNDCWRQTDGCRLGRHVLDGAWAHGTQSLGNGSVAGCVRPCARSSGQNMRVPTLRALPVGRRNWLEDFDATCAADENTMGISVQNNGHRGAFGCEHRFPDVSSQRGGNSRIDGSDEGIHLQQSQPEVEKDSTLVLRPQCMCVGTGFGQFKPTIHAAELPRQAQRNTMVPRFRSW